MEKKRFIRLVMSYGVQRNEAAQIAALVGTFGSYEAVFAVYRPLLAGRSVVKGFQKGFRNISETATFAARGFSDFFAAAFGGIDIATGEDQSVVVHHVRSGCGGAPSVQAVTPEEHRAAHAAERTG